MRFKVHVVGKSNRWRIDFLIWTDDYQIVEQIRRQYKNKKYISVTVEIIEE